MTRFSSWPTRILLAVALSTSLAACNTAQSQNTTSTEENSTTSTSEVAQSTQTTSTTPDVASSSTHTATFDGPKYITNTPMGGQATDEASVSDETCVIQPSDFLSQAESIGWDRSSITYNHIPKEWGTLTCRYEYITQSTSAPGTDRTRTTESGYFGENLPVEHTQVGDHNISYVMENSSEELVAIGIVDLEAQAQGNKSSGAYIMLNAWEQRGDGCAFAVSISCETREDAQVDVSAEGLIAEAYEPLEFLEGNTPAEGTAASCESDVSLTSADESHDVVIHRTQDVLVNLSKHKVVLADPASGLGSSTLSFDFAPEGGLDAMVERSADTSTYSSELGYTEVGASEVEDIQAEGRVWHARVVSKTISSELDTRTERELRAWTDVDGNALYVVAGMAEQEDAATALTRVLSGRISLG